MFASSPAITSPTLACLIATSPLFHWHGPAGFPSPTSKSLDLPKGCTGLTVTKTLCKQFHVLRHWASLRHSFPNVLRTVLICNVASKRHYFYGKPGLDDRSFLPAFLLSTVQSLPSSRERMMRPGRGSDSGIWGEGSQAPRRQPGLKAGVGRRQPCHGAGRNKGLEPPWRLPDLL